MLGITASMAYKTKDFYEASNGYKSAEYRLYKGDKLAYQVTLPGDSSKPWIVGINSHEAIGIGANQVIAK